MIHPTLLTYLTFVFTVVQQPAGEWLYFKMEPEFFTQASHTWAGWCPNDARDNIVLLAEQHPVVQGMTVGGVLQLTYKDGTTRSYRITNIDRYYQDGWINPAGVFRSEQDGSMRQANGVALDMYCQPDHTLTIQTCYDGIRGRLFIHAKPVEYLEKLESVR